MFPYYLLASVIIFILGWFLIFQRETGLNLFFAAFLALFEILLGMFLYVILFNLLISVYNYSDNESIILILILTIILGFIMYLVNRCLFLKKFNERNSVIIISEYIVQCILIFFTVIQASHQHLNYTNKFLRALAEDVGSLAVLPTLISIIIGIALYKLENKKK